MNVALKTIVPVGSCVGECLFDVNFSKCTKSPTSTNIQTCCLEQRKLRNFVCFLEKTPRFSDPLAAVLTLHAHRVSSSFPSPHLKSCTKFHRSTTKMSGSSAEKSSTNLRRSHVRAGRSRGMGDSSSSSSPPRAALYFPFSSALCYLVAEWEARFLKGNTSISVRDRSIRLVSELMAFPDPRTTRWASPTAAACTTDPTI